LYATVGASDYPVPGFSVEHRQEFFVGFSPEFDDIASSLARLGIYAQLTGKALGAGHIYLAPQGLTNGSQFSGFMIFAPLDDLPAPCELLDGRHVEFLMTIPVFESELDFASVNGVDSLLEAMESSSIPFWDPVRQDTFGLGRH
jgi:suppressor of fused protein SUFU